MPIFIDRHFVEGATQHALAHAHEKDLEIQDKYDIKFLTYWFDEERSTAFCLIDAPDKEAIQRAHDESHGMVPNEIIEVDPVIVENFLGRINDLVPFKSHDHLQVDSAFRAILFTDMQDSTRMTAMYGDTKALHLVHIHNVITRNALRNHNGREVKHTGDGIMATFIQARDAVKCATTIQEGHKAHLINQPSYPLNIRIGISAGEPIEEHGDFFGKAVQEAARLCSEAPPGEILASKLIRDLCHEELDSFQEVGDILLKGFNAPLKVYKVMQKSSSQVV